MNRSIAYENEPLEIRRFICPKCGGSSRHYIYQKIGALYVNCEECSLNYFFDWRTDGFRELGEFEKEYGEPSFENIDEEELLVVIDGMFEIKLDKDGKNEEG